MPLNAGLAGANILLGIYQGNKAAAERKKADEATMAAIAARSTYRVSDAARMRLGQTQGELNTIDPAVQAALVEAQQRAVNQTANANLNASSGAQALAVGNAAHQTAASITPQILEQQTHFHQQKDDNYNRALQEMSRQEEMQHQDEVQKNSDLTNFNLGKMGAASANEGQGIAAASMGLASLGNLGGGGGLGKIFGGAAKTAAPTGNAMSSPLYSTYLGVPRQQTTIPYPMGWNQF